MKRDLVSLADLAPEELERILDDTVEIKRRAATRDIGRSLHSRSIALLFQKPSLRTKVSFAVAVTELGGTSIYLGPEEVGVGKREPPEDVARVLSRFVHAVVFRAFAHADVEVMAKHASIPVINALSDAEHPCQAIADLFTIREQRGGLRGKVIAYVGDGNNVAASLVLGAAMVGASFRIASPAGYELPRPLLERACASARLSGAQVQQMADPWTAVKNADVVYTDVWTSMGQEQESERRRQAFRQYQVSEEIFSLAKQDALFMHPLPAHREEEVTPGVLEHPRSAVFAQAENRLHVQKALLLALLGGPSGL